MKLSIVVPVYNVEAYLAECIECLLDQDLDAADHEIVLVDDGSTDRSKEIAEQYAARHDRIVLLSQENSGLSVARNVGIAEAKGEFLYFIDSDDYIERKSLGKILAFMEKNSLDFCGFTWKRVPDRNLSNVPDWSCLEGEPEVLTGLGLIAKYGYASSVCLYVFKKDVAERHDIVFDPGVLIEDGPFTTKLLIYSERAVVLPVLLYYYYINERSLTKAEDAEGRRKLIEGYFYAVKQLGQLIELAKERDAPAAALRRMQGLQETYISHLLQREIRYGMPFEKIKEHMAALQRESALSKKNIRLGR
jgi:glycosyltransferase involved in cell wall biosynthesis